MTLQRGAMPHQLPVVLAGLALFAIAGCAATTAPAPSSSAAAPTSNLPSPAITTAAPPPAADGTDLAACADGACEVQIDGPVAIPLGPQIQVRNLQVESLAADTVTITAQYPGGTIRCNDCNVRTEGTSATAPMTARVSMHTGSRLSLSALTVEVVRIGQGVAVLHLQPS